MRIAIISVFTHPSRLRIYERSVMQSSVPELIAALCPPDTEIELYNEKEMMIPLDRDWDLVFFSYLHAFYEHTKVLSTILRRRGIKTVAGGRHVVDFPMDSQKYFDTIITGDPESNIPALISDLENNAMQRVYNNRNKGVSDILPYRYDLIDFKSNRYRLPGIEASRGCPFSCGFCVLTGREKYDYRPTRDIIREISTKMHWNNNFFGLTNRHFAFLDNNLGGSPTFLKELCEALIPLKKIWGCSLTFNILRDEKLVKLMSRAGCRYVYTGLESLNPESLKAMNKGQNKIKEMGSVINRCYSNGIVLSFGIIIGSDGDDNQYLMNLPDILTNMGSFAVTYMGMVCPYPGTPFFKKMERENRLMPGIRSRDLDGYTMCHQPNTIAADEVVEHYKRLVKTIPGLSNVVRHHYSRFFQSSHSSYKTMLIGSGNEILNLRRNIANKQRTYIAGQEPIEEWDEKMMRELDIEVQYIT